MDQILPLNISTGLDDQHQQQSAILERIEAAPNNALGNVSRVYADGSYYLLFKNDQNEDFWYKLSTLTPQGITALTQLLDDELIKRLDQIPNFAPGQGKIIWRVHTNCAYYETTTAAGVYNGLPPIVKQIDDTINQHLLPRH